MSKKPLPPKREPSPPLPTGGSSTGRPVGERVTQNVIKELQQKTANRPVLLAPRMELMRPEHEHRAVFCLANEGAFGALASTMEKDGWELVGTESCQRHIHIANAAGMAQGWMTFWKRLKKEEEAS